MCQARERRWADLITREYLNDLYAKMNASGDALLGCMAEVAAVDGLFGDTISLDYLFNDELGGLDMTKDLCSRFSPPDSSRGKAMSGLRALRLLLDGYLLLTSDKSNAATMKCSDRLGLKKSKEGAYADEGYCLALADELFGSDEAAKYVRAFEKYADLVNAIDVNTFRTVYVNGNVKGLNTKTVLECSGDENVLKAKKAVIMLFLKKVNSKSGYRLLGRLPLDIRISCPIGQSVGHFESPLLERELRKKIQDSQGYEISVQDAAKIAEYLFGKGGTHR